MGGGGRGGTAGKRGKRMEEKKAKVFMHSIFLSKKGKSQCRRAALLFAFSKSMVVLFACVYFWCYCCRMNFCC